MKELMSLQKLKSEGHSNARKVEKPEKSKISARHPTQTNLYKTTDDSLVMK